MSASRPRRKVLLLAGGLGTRLRPLTLTVPKCLVPVCGRALLDWWLDRFEAAAVSEVLINTHHLREQVVAHIEESNQGRSLVVREAFEPELLGSAGTVRANREWIEDGDEGLIVYADNLSDVDLGALLDFHRSHDDALTMMLFRTPAPTRCGIAELDAAGRVVSFVEKPKRPVSDLANGGIYALGGPAYREMADAGGFDLGHDVLPRFVGRMRGWLWSGYHRDIGTPESLAAAEREAGPRRS